jgi:hypothetical protein
LARREESVRRSPAAAAIDRRARRMGAECRATAHERSGLLSSH